MCISYHINSSINFAFFMKPSQIDYWEGKNKTKQIPSLLLFFPSLLLIHLDMRILLFLLQNYSKICSLLL